MNPDYQPQNQTESDNSEDESDITVIRPTEQKRNVEITHTIVVSERN